MWYKKIIFLFVCATSTINYSQTVEEVLNKMSKEFSAAKPLQYSSVYNLYKDPDATKIEESYKGLFYKNASNEIYMKIGETEMVNLKTVNIKIDHTEKAVEFSNPVTNSLKDFDIKQLSDLCKISAFNNKNTYWEIILIPKPYSNLLYSKISLQISKSYFLKKQIFYYNTATDFSKNYNKSDLHYPKLEIIYTNYNRNTIPTSFFNSATYFKLLNKKKIILSGKFTNYDIIDTRN